jgi:hypothetical protein
MLFGINIADTKKPEIRAGVIYSFGDTTEVDRTNKPKELKFISRSNGTIMAEQIEAFGTIGVGINVVDKQDGALNNNGIYNLKMTVNGKKVYEYEIDKYSFSESRFINTLIDYGRYTRKKQQIQKCFVEPMNKLSIYENLVNNGFIKIENGFSYNIKITASDFKGNTRELIIPVKGKKDSLIVRKEISKTPYFFKADEFNKITKENVTVAFPKFSFYNNIFFNFLYKDSIVKLHDHSIPLHKKFTLTFDISNYPEKIRDQLFIARRLYKNKYIYSYTIHKKNKIYSLNNTLGDYTIIRDSIKPKIRPLGFRNKQWLTNYRYLKLKISDGLSGIKSYRGEIDGQWILLEYDPKKGNLTYDFNDKKFNGTKHDLKVTVIDNVNNTNTYIANFYRKDLK